MDIEIDYSNYFVTKLKEGRRGNFLRLYISKCTKVTIGTQIAWDVVCKSSGCHTVSIPNAWAMV